MKKRTSRDEKSTKCSQQKPEALSTPSAQGRSASGLRVPPRGLEGGRAEAPRCLGLSLGTELVLGYLLLVPTTGFYCSVTWQAFIELSRNPFVYHPLFLSGYFSADAITIERSRSLCIVGEGGRRHDNNKGPEFGPPTSCLPKPPHT